ncbi:MAG: glycosyltransferase [Oscillospiraceae bacterium]|nr:glycosyltransferase [Oscillospiraceae bacterium]
MEQKKVAILISTYNGEKYIADQFESIFAQTYKNIDIFVRDDGSTDGSLDILRNYEKQGKINLVEDKNIGVWRSVNWLAKNTKGYDYYSFGDQDDIWMPDKIEKAVNALNNMKQDVPALYFCNYDYYDGEMKFLSHKKPIDIDLTFINSLVNFFAYGFTCVINEPMKLLFLRVSPEVLFPHDYLFLILGTALGNVVYDGNYISAKYRRHGKNVSVTDESFIKIFLWRVKNFLINDSFKYVDKWNMINEIYGEDLCLENKKILRWFISSKYNIKNAFRRAFYPKRFRGKLFDEITLRLMFIIGKI